MKTLNVAAFKEKLFLLHPRGGTDMEEGINGGVKLFESLAGEGALSVGKQNRIMFLTDARVRRLPSSFAPPHLYELSCRTLPQMQPNSGATSPSSLFGICKANAEERKIYTSFFGLGVDFGVEVRAMRERMVFFSVSLTHSPCCVLPPLGNSWWTRSVTFQRATTSPSNRPRSLRHSWTG